MNMSLHDIGKWDMIIAHPPCTYLTNVATRHFSLKMTKPEKVVKRWENRALAVAFFMQFALADCPKIAVENPVGFMTAAYRKPDQIIHPYMFAEGEDDTENYVTKATCLWLKGLEPLITNGGKAVMLSIRPKWVEKIASGEKIVEVRKTRPKLKTPIKCYIYQTGKNLLKAVFGSDFNKSGFVIGEFVCDEISGYDSDDILYFTRLCDTSCASKVELLGYKKDSDYLFGWHISDLKIYDEPKELSEFGLKRPPQSWCYVEELK